MKPAYLISGSGRISGVFNGTPFSVDTDNKAYAAILAALRDEEFENFEDLLNEALAVKRYTDGKIVVEGNSVMYNGAEVHNVVVEKILEFMAKDYPYKPLIAFLENLLANPSRRAINELYTFLVHKGLPITDDGCFLGYKGLRKDYRDIHSGKFSNVVGSVHEMPRNEVCDDFGVACSQGFHVGSYEYANSFRSSDGQLVLCKVNPKDVVSVPADSQCQKLRTCRYEVVADCSGLIQTEFVPDVSRPYDDVIASPAYPEDYDEYDDEDYYEEDE